VRRRPTCESEPGRGATFPLRRKAWSLIVDEHERAARQFVETTAALAALQEAIEGELSPHQSAMLVVIALDGVPIDVLAERLNTTGVLCTKPCTTHEERSEPPCSRGLGIDEQQARERA